MRIHKCVVTQNFIGVTFMDFLAYNAGTSEYSYGEPLTIDRNIFLGTYFLLM